MNKLSLGLMSFFLITCSFGCSSKDDKENTLVEDNFINECKAFDPRTYYEYDKNNDYGILRELSNEEQNEVVSAFPSKCAEAVSTFDYGSCYFNVVVTDENGNKSYKDFFTGYHKRIYTNAVEVVYKDQFNFDTAIPGIDCFYNDGNNYFYVDAFYNQSDVQISTFESMHITESDFDPRDRLSYFNGTSISVLWYFNQIASTFQYDEYKAYKTNTGYVFKKVPYEHDAGLYSIYDYAYIFSDDMYLTHIVSYHELTEAGKEASLYMREYERYWGYSLFKYHESGKTPSKDLGFIKKELEVQDYLYLETPNFKVAYIDDVETINSLQDYNFPTKCKASFSHSHYYKNSLSIGFEIDLPCSNLDSLYNAVLADFKFTIKGRLNGKSYFKSFTYKLNNTDYWSGYDYYYTSEKTFVVVLPFEDIDSKRLRYSVSSDLTVNDDGVIFDPMESFSDGVMDYTI